MTNHDISMWIFLLKRFSLILLVAAAIAGIGYLFYDSLHTTTDEVNKIDNYQTFAEDEVRYVLANLNPTTQQMIDDNPEVYDRFVSQMDSLLMDYHTYQARHKKVLSTLSKSRDKQIKRLSKCILKNYRETPIALSPFQEDAVESINEFDRLHIKLIAFEDYKSSNVVYRFMETNSGIHFKLSLGLMCTCEADSADLARYSHSIRPAFNQ